MPDPIQQLVWLPLAAAAYAVLLHVAALAMYRTRFGMANLLAGATGALLAAWAGVALVGALLEGGGGILVSAAVAVIAQTVVLGRVLRPQVEGTLGNERAFSLVLVLSLAGLVVAATLSLWMGGGQQIFGLPIQGMLGQLLIGLINGSFYALLSLGLAVIFGLLNIINFAHGAQYMMGAFCAYLLLHWTGLSYWWALLLAPLVVGATGLVIERLMLARLYKLDHLYGLLLTFGLALVIQGLFRQYFGSTGLPYAMPKALEGGQNLGFMFLPNYRAWVIAGSLAVCLGTWFMIEKTKLGSYLRAATENPQLVQAFGINVPRMITLTYGFGVALAAFAGVMAAPIYSVSPLMGADLIIVVFAVVVIGGMGSIMGSIVTGFILGLLEGLTKVFYPEASNTVIFIIMAIVLMFKPAGLFGTQR